MIIVVKEKKEQRKTSTLKKRERKKKELTKELNLRLTPVKLVNKKSLSY